MKARTRENRKKQKALARSLDLSLKLRAVLLLGFCERHISISFSLSFPRLDLEQILAG
jgi:hypothetical protein